MNLQVADLQSVQAQSTDVAAGVPPEVLQLFPREREIALLVYNRGLATAKDIEAVLNGSLSNAAIRSMLNRLVRKGILFPQRFGSRRTLVYAAALSESFAREMALKQFADDFCRGSISTLANEISELLAARRAGPTEGFGLSDEVLPAQVRDLFPRMREIATIVYASGGTTVRDVQLALSDDITVYAIRTMLGRMVTRKIIKRRRSGRHSEMIYLPGLVTKEVRAVALRRFVDRRFGGSAAVALQVVLQLLRAQPEVPSRRARASNGRTDLSLELA